ncbi:SbcC/MukB-like Walker B domain-containing protein, partial [Pseudonocardia yunnanensis]
VGREVRAAWEALRQARDPLVPLGAPAVGGDELLAGWQALTGWAEREAALRTERLAEAERAARSVREARDAVERRIEEDLLAHQVTAAPPVGTSAPAAVAAVLARSRSAQERIAERRASAEKIRADRDEAESAQQVAKLLGNLLRSDGFPRWLVASALDALVADASRSLAELSAGQFELTHEGGEFLVIDHADADARRPVKTLSGGETFQASLALALALSAQMSGLAAKGAARLESIFLDEGFGTLDETNLEVVAGTLESLSTRGDRMVGVITHVAALAERVPVRFAVRRDQRTSSVTREGL